jgi:hypothetical protein
MTMTFHRKRTTMAEGRWFRIGALAIAAPLWACSGRTQTSGETHFLACSTNTDCAVLGTAFECQAGECRDTTPGDGGSTGAGGSTDAGGSTGTGGTSGDAASDFEVCGTHGPPSTCNLADTCKSLGCGGLEFDENACRRADCAMDGDCPADQRCVALECGSALSCAYSDQGMCNCSGLTICLAGHACNPVGTVGPRGTWQQIEILQGAGPCPAGQPCTWTWTVAPDGTVSANKNGTASEAQLSDVDLGELRKMIEGPELRPGLRDGFTCDAPPTDTSLSIRLVMDTATLEHEATGCMVGPDGNVAQRVFQLVTKY